MEGVGATDVGAARDVRGGAAQDPRAVPKIPYPDRPVLADEGDRGAVARD